MKALLLTVLLLPVAQARAAEDAASSSTTPPAIAAPAGVPVETIKVTDQDPGLFERVRDTYLRAEKKGEIASSSASAPAATR